MIIKCQYCGKPIGDDEDCYEIRQGYADGDGDDAEFIPEEHQGFFCNACGDIFLQAVSK